MLTAATYNIHRCVGSDAIYRPERIVEVLRVLGADLVGLQEVDSHIMHREGSQLDYIVKESGYLPVTGRTMEQEGGNYGNAILSRLPVLEIRRHILSVQGHEPRGAIDIDVSIGEKRLRVINTHLGLRKRERMLQVRKLLEILGDAKEPVVLLGDFNEWLPFIGADRELGRKLKRGPAHRTYPSLLPLFALDGIYLGEAIGLGGTKVFNSPLTRKASDHLPVKAWFRV